MIIDNKLVHFEKRWRDTERERKMKKTTKYYKKTLDCCSNNNCRAAVNKSSVQLSHSLCLLYRTCFRKPNNLYHLRRGEINEHHNRERRITDFLFGKMEWEQIFLVWLLINISTGCIVQFSIRFMTLVHFLCLSLSLARLLACSLARSQCSSVLHFRSIQFVCHPYARSIQLLRTETWISCYLLKFVQWNVMCFAARRLQWFNINHRHICILTQPKTQHNW